MEFQEHLKRLLENHHLHPRRRLGQNFMVDERVLGRVVEYANLEESDVVLEVGGGLGFLTGLLAEDAGRVITVEKDPRFAAFLREKYGGEERIEVREGDFLKMDIAGYNKVVSNPPYLTISKIIFKLLEDEFDLGVLTLQKEFAEKMTADPGCKDYGRLAVVTYARAEVDLLESVPPSAFYPQPKVTSIITRLHFRREPPFKVGDWKFFNEVVRVLFTQKNRTVRRALRVLSKQTPLIGLAEATSQLPFLDRRVFTLMPEEFGVLTDALHQKLA
jgi:16S rRNA (adenine1518-N6/adenine1519-N6)-dimethyltransferase